MLYVYPYKTGSRSAIALAQTLGKGTLIRRENSKFNPVGKTVINWGASALPPAFLKHSKLIVNPFEKVKICSNKKTFFEFIKDKEVSIPRFTFNKEEAAKWLVDKECRMVFARTVLDGHSGEGIVKIQTTQELDNVPDNTLLVEYIPKKREFRIHTSKTGVVIFKQEKLKRQELPVNEVDFHIRNHDNGFVFAHNTGKEIPNSVVEEANKVVNKLGLDFGAVDIIWNEKQNKPYVLEVNTAPGLEGTTLEKYSAFFKNTFEDEKNA